MPEYLILIGWKVQ